MANVDSVRTMAAEGESFYRRHVGGLGHAAAGIGGLFWGLLRAAAECPNCPGVFRTPVHAGGADTGGDDTGGDEHEEFWRCPNCGGVWVWKNDDLGKGEGVK